MNTEYPSIAAVDLGSNSFHLLVARQVDGRFQVLHKEKQRVCLAAGLDDEYYLSEEAITRALHVLKQFAATLDSFPHSHVQVVATYTLRNSKNVHSFLKKAQRCFPFKINVISGQEEARLIYQGVANYIYSDHNRLVIDIGGGSTELVIGQHFEHKQLTSRNMGSATVTKQFFADGKLSVKRFNQAQIKVRQDLEPLTANFLTTGWKSCLGTSGTIKTLVAINQANFAQNQLTLESLEKIKAFLLAQKHIEQLNIKGLHEERHSNIVGGLVILIAVFEQLNITELDYCDYSLREGLLNEMQRDGARDIRSRTIHTLSEHYTVDTVHSNNICKTIKQLFMAVSEPWQLKQFDLQMLCWAAQLHEVGLTINSSGLHKHSAYIVMHSQLPGFSQEQQMILSTLIRFHRKKIKLTELCRLNEEQKSTLNKLLPLLRLAIIFNQKRQYQQIPALVLQAHDEQLSIKIDKEWRNKHTILNADLQQEQQYLKPLNVTLLIH
jgi:exopolyphosphatase/guanosine-5'-triphosphate,3'-diphosphate pyrophosphatase